MIKKTAYKCEHGKCKKVLISQTGMKRHEKNCYWNPSTRSCITCINYQVCAGWDEEKEELFSECLAKVDISKKLKYKCSLHVKK